MKKIFKITVAVMVVMFSSIFAMACSPKDYYLNEDTFFLVMTNMLYYPEQYEGSTIDYDCFTYELHDVNGVSYICGVRKCSSGYGCQCGKDTIIGFVLLYDGDLPSPKNQSEDTPDKTWVHLSGKLKSTKKLDITIFAYNNDGSVDTTRHETISMLQFNVNTCTPIADYSGLSYYVTK